MWLYRFGLECSNKLVKKRHAVAVHLDVAVDVAREHLVELAAAAQLVHTVLLRNLCAERLRLCVRRSHSLLKLVDPLVEATQALNARLLLVNTPHAIHGRAHVTTQPRAAHVAVHWRAAWAPEARKPIALGDGRMQIVSETLKVELLAVAMLQQRHVLRREAAHGMQICEHVVCGRKGEARFELGKLTERVCDALHRRSHAALKHGKLLKGVCKVVVISRKVFRRGINRSSV